ncbi:MAG: endopeptidase La [Actinobacteria bacterium]|nr:endopeptidase La [Actinomycetota bacterium]
MVVTIRIESDDARAAVDAAPRAGGEVLLVPELAGRYATVGTTARIEQSGEMPGGGRGVVVRATGRAVLGRAALDDDGGGLWVEVTPVMEPEPTPRARQLAAEYRAVVERLLETVGARRFAAMLREVRSPGALADTFAWWPELDTDRKVELLETVDVEARLTKAVAWARDALAEAEVAAEISGGVAEGLDKAQRDAILRRQLAAIRTELGEGGEDDPVGAYREKLGELVAAGAPEAVVAAVTREIDRLERTGEQNVEASWIRAWLDTVFGLPWAVRTEDDLDLARARAVLDEDHTGLDEVKDRIVEFLAVRRLRRERGVEAAPGRRGGGTILALAGPPGVGKTSLGESVARALGRRFVRTSLGGIHDEAEIRGHRRTYVGARAGRIVRALSDAGSMNPVVLLDEVDKVGADWRGDPSSALLEVLDPAQNHTFRDHYLEFEIDLSEVLFLATANVLDRIPEPLLDRMEVIRIEGYSEDEKLAIARDHLLPRVLDRNGVHADEVSVGDEVIRAVISRYTREAGVRRLEQRLDRLVRKAARQVAEGASVPVVIEPGPLRDALGRPIPAEDPAGRVSVPGVATGLAVTGAGGDVLFVEAAAMPAGADGETSLKLTGQLGEVMRESGEIALSYLRSHAETLGVDLPAGRRFHIHFPAGAVPKDGPSAGVTMTTALASLVSGRQVRPEVAMTGEITLHGRVLPIGGVKEKVLAAKRAGITEVLLPAGNREDATDLPDDVAAAVTLHFVDDVRQVLDLALQPAAPGGAGRIGTPAAA